MNLPFRFAAQVGTYYGFFLSAADSVASPNLILSTIQAGAIKQGPLDLTSPVNPGWLTGFHVSWDTACVFSLGLYDGTTFTELYREYGSNGLYVPWLTREMDANGGGGLYVRQNAASPLDFVFTPLSIASPSTTVNVSGDIDWIPDGAAFQSPLLT